MPAATFQHFAVTINNPIPDDESWLRACDNFAVTQRIKITFCRFQPEIGQNGTRHLQCYFQLSGKMAPRDFTDRIAEHLHARPHCEGCRGSSEDNLQYCSKDDTREEGADYHDCGEPIEIESRVTRQGQRTDLDAVREAIEAGTPLDELMGPHFEAFAKYDKFFTKYHTMVHQKQARSALQQTMSSVSLRPWQSQLVESVSGNVSPRQVHWWWDPTGNKGKSFVASYLRSLDGWIHCQVMKKSDLLYLLTKNIMTAKGVMFDLSRTTADGSVSVVYDVCEMLKNQVFCSGKYDSVTLETPPVHVVVFANYEPDRTAWSADRYDVHKIL